MVLVLDGAFEGEVVVSLVQAKKAKSQHKMAIDDKNAFFITTSLSFSENMAPSGTVNKNNLDVKDSV